MKIDTEYKQSNISDKFSFSIFVISITNNLKRLNKRHNNIDLVLDYIQHSWLYFLEYAANH